MEPLMNDNITDTPMLPEHVEAFFAALDLAEETGRWPVVDLWLNKSADVIRLQRFGNARILSLLKLWREKLQKAQAYEALHGQGSLFVKDHPFNKEMGRISQLEKQAEIDGCPPILILNWTK